ncbi:MAG: NUDIX hydrolase [Candidatus Gottesmanbacteria bacterium]
MKKTWLTLSSKVLHGNDYFSLYEDTYQKPNGLISKYFFIKKRPFVSIIPFASENEIYLVRQFRYTIQEHTWEIPEGFTENNEEPLDSAKRELIEETGIKAQIWKELGYAYLAVGHTNQKYFIFIAEKLNFLTKIKPGDEIEEIAKFNLKQIRDMILNNIITDAVSLTSLYKYFLVSGRRL